MEHTELIGILEKFAESGWDLIDAPAKAWLTANSGNGADENTTITLIKAIEQADAECGSCGCEFDPLYKKALAILKTA